MKILIITQWYPPEPQQLLADLTQTLLEMGHDITVLTGFPNYPSGKIYPGYRLKILQREIIDGAKIIRIPLYPDHSDSLIKRGLNLISFTFSAILISPMLIHKVDVIYVIHPPIFTGFVGWLIGRIKSVPFILEIQDMWPETLVASGVKNKYVINLMKIIANWVYERATSIRVISLGFRENLIAKGVKKRKIHVISNWVNTELYKPAEYDLELASKIGLEGKFNIMYAGAIGLVHGIDSVVEAAYYLQDVPDIQIVVVGDGVELPKLKCKAEKRGLGNILFLGRYPIEQMSKLYALADALLIHIKDNPLFRITIPHKTFSYMASGKPIIAAIEGDAAEIVASSKAGICCSPSQPELLSKKIRLLYNLPKEQRDDMGNNGRLAVCNFYSRQNLVGAIEQIMKQAKKDKKHSYLVRSKVYKEKTAKHIIE